MSPGWSVERLDGLNCPYSQAFHRYSSFHKCPSKRELNMEEGGSS